jgi:hypothetical protein
LDSWDFRELRALDAVDNAARFRNEFRDMYNVAFPVREDRKKKKDRKKPWLDDPGFKVIVREKGVIYSIKVKGQEREGDRERLAEVTREENRARKRLRKA